MDRTERCDFTGRTYRRRSYYRRKLDVEPYTVVVGNPAKPVRKRFDEELIALLAELKWWDLPAEEINRLIPVLSGSNLKRVKSALKKKINQT